MAKLKGQCLCGKIHYEYEGATGNLVHCHCSRCRQWHGAAFRSRIVISKAGYRLTQGAEYLAQYQATPKVIKTFCRHCGSSLATIYPTRDNLLGLPIAGCEGEFDLHQEFHIHTASKASWWQISDNHPQYRAMPEETELTHCLYD
ncbi:MAG: GFA family protein [Cyanobacteria bacterium J06635_13]